MLGMGCGFCEGGGEETSLVSDRGLDEGGAGIDARNVNSLSCK